jgi:spore germination cell wall hydrolase CwlJ-like protein
MTLLAPAILCLALNIYFESRDQSYEGQVAVTEVVFNRVADGRWPNEICAVITQEGQFSWYTQGQTTFDIKEQKAWESAVYLAHELYVDGHPVSLTDGAVFYHVKREEHHHDDVIQIGDHVFLKTLRRR